MSEEKKYVTNFTFPNGETFYVKDTETYTKEEIDNKIDSSGSGGDTNVQSDWNQTDSTADDYIKNKPDIYTKNEINQKLVSVMTYKGTKATVSELPNSGNQQGDVWHVNADGSEWAWNGSSWEELGKTIDISGKVDKVTGKDLSTNDFTDAYKTKLDNIEAGAQANTVDSVNGKTGVVVLDASDVGALPDSTLIPSKTSDLTNDSGYQTAAQVQTAISGVRQLPLATPEQYGAVGDGVTDDTAAVRQAMQNDAVYLRGTYLVTEAITAAARIVMGDGNAKIAITAGGFTFSNDVVMSGFNVEMSSHVDLTAFTCEGALVADNIHITGGRIGIYVTSSYKNCEITNSTFKNLWGLATAAIVVLYAGTTRIANCLIENINNNHSIDADGIRVWQSRSIGRPSVVIEKCEFHNCRGRCLKMSTMNNVVRNCYLHNDANFELTQYDLPIDVQNGNSEIVGNTIISRAGVHLSIEEDIRTHHVIKDNYIKYNGSEQTGGNHVAFTVNDAAADDDATPAPADITFENNTLDWEDDYSIVVGYVHDATIRILNNTVLNRSAFYPMRVSGTQDDTCRFEILGNTCDYKYFIKFDGANMPNVLGDRTVNVTTALSVTGVKMNTSFLANTSAIDGVAGNKALMRTVGANSNYPIVLLSDDISICAYGKNGVKIFSHDYRDTKVDSVNNKTGAVALNASDVGALPDSTLIPSKTSDLTNDSGYQTAAQVQTAIANAAELPTGGSAGDFLRKTSSGVAWETVPAAESNNFGGGA